MEIWKNINDYYMVSNYGNVKSLDRYIKRKKNGTIFCKGRLLRQGTDKDGYKFVCISIDGKLKSISTHRLVAEFFVEKVKNSNEVNHIDFNKKNNHFENLEWVTRQQNISHSTKNGMWHGNTNRLSKEHISMIREMNLYCNKSFSYIWISKAFKICEATARNIILKKKRWSKE